MKSSRRRVLVTGATGGIGRAIADAFAATDSTVVLADRHLSDLSRLKQQLSPNAEAYVYDQADAASIRKLISAAGPVDVLVNNAAIILRKPLLRSSAEEVEQVIAVDLVGPIVLATGVARSMIKRRRGVIINISSQHAFKGAPGRGIYSTAKAGLVQFTRSAGLEWAPYGVRVVGVAPGVTNTPMLKGSLSKNTSRSALLRTIPLRRIGTPADVARVAVFLASDAAGLIVGQTVVADGGSVLV